MGNCKDRVSGSEPVLVISVILRSVLVMRWRTALCVKEEEIGLPDDTCGEETFVKFTGLDY